MTVDTVDVPAHIHKLQRLVVQLLSKTQQSEQALQVLSLLQQLSTEIMTMSASLTQQLQDAINAISADVDAVSAEVTALLAGVTAGDPITQAQVDALTSIDARLKAIPAAPGG